MEKRYIKDISVGEQVKSIFGVLKKTLANYKPGSNKAPGQFLKLLLADCSGTMEARVWNDALKLAESFSEGDIVYVEGTVTEYNGLQINITKIEKYNGPVDPALFQPCTSKDRHEMINQLKRLINSVNNIFLKKLLISIFEDEQIKRAFVNAPAAQKIHHAYVGGLLEHSLEVAKICDNMALTFSDIIDRDALITGALLHDIGKLKEYNLNSISFEMTNMGKLIGHLVLGKEMVDEKIRGIDEFPEELKIALDHMIISHHGEREWGSPEVPKTMEAFALFHADLLSARLNQFAGIIRNHHDPESSWTPWDKFLERSAYVQSHKEIWQAKNDIAPSTE